jgi:hypothetical protein
VRNALNELRIKNKRTQKKLDNKLDTKQAHISRLEKGEVPPPISVQGICHPGNVGRGKNVLSESPLLTAWQTANYNACVSNDLSINSAEFPAY